MERNNIRQDVVRFCKEEEIFDDSYLIEEKQSISAFTRPEDLSFELFGRFDPGWIR